MQCHSPSFNTRVALVRLTKGKEMHAKNERETVAKKDVEAFHLQLNPKMFLERKKYASESLS